MAKELLLRGGTTVQHSTFTGAEREVTVDTTKDTLVVHNGLTTGGIPLATEAFVGTIISDATPSETKVYSSSKTQALHEAQAIAIANLSACTGIIVNTTTPVFSPIPLIATDMPFSVSQTTTDINVFDFDDINNTITFKRIGTYNFFSTINIGSTSNTARTVTFNIINVSDSSVVTTQSAVIDTQNGTSESLPLNTLVEVLTVPLTVKVQAYIDLGTDKVLNSFSSILATSSVSLDLNTFVTQDSNTGAAAMPYGTTAQRPVAPAVGYMRFNTDLGKAEVWNGSLWAAVGAGATGGGADTVFVETSYTVTQNYTLTAGKSAMTVGNANGDVVINDSVTITIPDASQWTVVGA